MRRYLGTQKFPSADECIQAYGSLSVIVVVLLVKVMVVVLFPNVCPNVFLAEGLEPFEACAHQGLPILCVLVEIHKHFTRVVAALESLDSDGTLVIEFAIR